MAVRECACCDSLLETEERTLGPTQAGAEAKQPTQVTARALNPSPSCYQPVWPPQLSSTISIEYMPCQAPPGTGAQGNSLLSKMPRGYSYRRFQHPLTPDAWGWSGCVCMHVCIHACVCARACLRVCMCLCACMCVFRPSCVHMSMHACVCMFMCACMFVCVCICACMHECACTCVHTCLYRCTCVCTHVQAQGVRVLGASSPQLCLQYEVQTCGHIFSLRQIGPSDPKHLHIHHPPTSLHNTSITADPCFQVTGLAGTGRSKHPMVIGKAVSFSIQKAGIHRHQVGPLRVTVCWLGKDLLIPQVLAGSHDAVSRMELGFPACSPSTTHNRTA